MRDSFGYISDSKQNLTLNPKEASCEIVEANNYTLRSLKKKFASNHR